MLETRKASITRDPAGSFTASRTCLSSKDVMLVIYAFMNSCNTERNQLYCVLNIGKHIKRNNTWREQLYTQKFTFEMSKMTTRKSSKTSCGPTDIETLALYSLICLNDTYTSHAISLYHHEVI